MPKNALLLRRKGGFSDKADAGSISTYGRREAFLSAATVDSAAAIESTGAAALSVFSSPRVSVSATYEPASDAETPYVGVFPGDTLSCPNDAGTPTTYRVEGFTVTESDDGYLTFTPELSSLVDTALRRQQTWLSRVGTGTLGGRSTTASLLPDVDAETSGGRIGTRDVAFSKGVLATGLSPDLIIAKPARITMVQATIFPTGTTSTTFRVLKNGSPISWVRPGFISASTTWSLTSSVGRLVLVPSGDDTLVNDGDLVTIDLQAVSTGAENFSVTATLADVF